MGNTITTNSVDARNTWSGSGGLYLNSAAATLTANAIIISHTTGVYVDSGSAVLEGTSWYSNTTNTSGLSRPAGRRDRHPHRHHIAHLAGDRRPHLDGARLQRRRHLYLGHRVDGRSQKQRLPHLLAARAA